MPVYIVSIYANPTAPANSFALQQGLDLSKAYKSDKCQQLNNSTIILRTEDSVDTVMETVNKAFPSLDRGIQIVVAEIKHPVGMQAIQDQKQTWVYRTLLDEQESL